MPDTMIDRIDAWKFHDLDKIRIGLIGNSGVGKTTYLFHLLEVLSIGGAELSLTACELFAEHDDDRNNFQDANELCKKPNKGLVLHELRCRYHNESLTIQILDYPGNLMSELVQKFLLTSDFYFFILDDSNIYNPTILRKMDTQLSGFICNWTTTQLEQNNPLLFPKPKGVWGKLVSLFSLKSTRRRKKLKLESSRVFFLLNKIEESGSWYPSTEGNILFNKHNDSILFERLGWAEAPQEWPYFKETILRGFYSISWKSKLGKIMDALKIFLAHFYQEHLRFSQMYFVAYPITHAEKEDVNNGHINPDRNLCCVLENRLVFDPLKDAIDLFYRGKRIRILNRVLFLSFALLLAGIVVKIIS